MTWWNGIAGAASEHMEGNAVRANTRAENRIRQANASASNRVRRASNALASARGNLARYMLSVNNQESMQAAGKAQDENTRAGIKAQEQLSRKGLFDQVAYAEQSGRAFAQQGALGVRGSVVDNVNAATALRAALVAEGVAQQKVDVSYGIALRAQTIASQMTRSLDGSVILDSMDYNEDVALVRQEYSNFQNALRGFAKGMGQGANLFDGQNAGSPQQYKVTQQDYDDLRVRQRASSYTEPTDYGFSRDTQLGSGGSDTFGIVATEQSNPYAIDYGGKVKFNLNVDSNFGGL